MIAQRPGPDGAFLNVLLRALDRLHQENPGALRTFAAWLDAPGHSDSITLHFYNGKLNTVERRQVAK